MNQIIRIIEEEVRKGFPIISRNTADKLELSFKGAQFEIKLNGKAMHSFGSFADASKKFRSLSDKLNLPTDTQETT